MNLLELLDRQPRPLSVAAACILTAAIAALDYVTSWEFAFSIFYLLPICLVTLAAGRWPGLALSLASAVIWLVVERATNPHYTHAIAPYWNAATRLVVFVLFTVLLAALKAAWQREKRMADVIRDVYHDATLHPPH